MAELPEHIHPHLLQHHMLTWLTAQGLPDAQIQLISGHASKKSLEVYQHLSLSAVQPSDQDLRRGYGTVYRAAQRLWDTVQVIQNSQR